jgi:hypothetical protein
MSAPSTVDLARELAHVKQQITSIFSLLGQKAAPRDGSIAGFCRRHGFSRGKYLLLRAEGKGPREMAVGSRRIITEEAERDWLREREAEAVAIAAQREAEGTRQGKVARKRFATTNSTQIEAA